MDKVWQRQLVATAEGCELSLLPQHSVPLQITQNLQSSKQLTVAKLLHQLQVLVSVLLIIQLDQVTWQQ